MSLRHPGIKARIAGGSFAIAALICLVAGVVIDAHIGRIARYGTESVLRSDSAPYAVAIVDEPGEGFDAPGPSQLIAVVGPTGDVAVDTLPAGVLEQVELAVRAGSTGEVLAEGLPYLVRVEAVDAPDGTWHVVSARDASEESLVLGQMRVLLVGGLAAITVAVTLAAWLLTSASLGPVRRIRRTAERLLREPGDELLPVGAADDEVTRLAHTLNELIVELRAAADRERQLVSDASHELRTPLAILLTQLELALARPASLEALVDDVRAADRSARRLSRLVESLLELSRIESGTEPGQSSAAELAEEVRDAVGRAEFRAEDGVEIVGDVSGDAASGGFGVRAEDVGRIVDNLVSNALRAMDGSGRLGIRFAVEADRAVLEVADTGGGLDPAFLPRARDRFSRADVARTAGDGVGLGLAIVAAIADRAGGELELFNGAGVGLTVRITLPAT